MTPAPPPGNIHTSPSEDYWAQVDLAGARQAVNLVNGVIVDGLGHVSLDSGPSNTAQQPNIHQGQSYYKISVNKIGSRKIFYLLLRDRFRKRSIVLLIMS